MIVVKYDSEVGTLKADEDLLDVFQRNCLRRIVLGTRLTDPISNSRLYEKFRSIPLSRAITRERLRWLGHVLQMKHARLPKIFLSANCLRLNRKQVIRGWGERMS